MAYHHHTVRMRLRPSEDVKSESVPNTENHYRTVTVSVGDPAPLGEDLGHPSKWAFLLRIWCYAGNPVKCRVTDSSTTTDRLLAELAECPSVLRSPARSG